MQNFSLRRGVPLCSRGGGGGRTNTYPAKSAKIEGFQFPRPGSLSEAEFDADHEYVISFCKFRRKNSNSRLFRKSCFMRFYGLGSDISMLSLHACHEG